jgi:hypothetical protein
MQLTKDSPVEDFVEFFKNFDDAKRLEIFEHFCRVCATPIEHTDWFGQNFCDSCSDHPRGKYDS